MGSGRRGRVVARGADNYRPLDGGHGAAAVDLFRLPPITGCADGTTRHTKESIGCRLQKRTPLDSRRRRQGSLTRSAAHGDTPRRGPLAELSTEDLLARHPAGRTKPLRVLDLILSRFNMQHTALEKTVSHKTRHDRALFLRRFFRDLKARAGFRRIPDPRSLRQKHVQAMVTIWQREPLAPATIQTYLSFLRGLALWLRKPGMIGPPASYGLQLAEYERHEYAQRDKSWTPKGIDVDALLNEIALYDARACACMRLMQALAFRKKESLLIRPFVDVVPATETDLPVTQRTAEWFVDVHGKGGRKRWVAIDSQQARDAIANAQRIVPLGTLTWATRTST